MYISRTCIPYTVESGTFFINPPPYHVFLFLQNKKNFLKNNYAFRMKEITIFGGNTEYID